jgi:hypothetical protein
MIKAHSKAVIARPDENKNKLGQSSIQYFLFGFLEKVSKIHEGKK